MSDYLGNMAARALGLSVVARPRPLLFEPGRAAPETLAAEPAAVSPPRAPGATETPRAAARREQSDPPREITPRQQPPMRSPEPEIEVPPVRASSSEASPVRAHTRAAPTRVDRPADTPTVAAAEVVRSVLPPERMATPADHPVETTPPARPTRRAPEPGLAVRPSFPPPARRAPEPTVRVSIGRIDVRAVKAEQSPEPRKKTRPGPRMSLDEYLGRTGERTR